MKNLLCSLAVSHIFRMSLTNVVNEVRVWVSCARSLLEIICNLLLNKTIKAFSLHLFLIIVLRWTGFRRFCNCLRSTTMSTQVGSIIASDMYKAVAYVKLQASPS